MARRLQKLNLFAFSLYIIGKEKLGCGYSKRNRGLEMLVWQKPKHARLRNVTFSIYDRVPALLFVDLAFVIDNG